MTVEDIVEAMGELVSYGSLFIETQPDPWAANFITNVANYVGAKRPLSTEQARIVLKLAHRIEPVFAEVVKRTRYYPKALSHAEFRSILEAPSYRQPTYQSANIPKEARYLGDNKIGFRFKRNDQIINDIKALKARSGSTLGTDPPWFNREFRLWVVSVSSVTLDAIVTIINKHRFHVDDALIDYLALCADSRARFSALVYDPSLDVMALQVNDNSLLGWWAKNVARGEVM